MCLQKNILVAFVIKALLDGCCHYVSSCQQIQTRRSVSELAMICGISRLASVVILHTVKATHELQLLLSYCWAATLNFFNALLTNFQVFPGNKDRNTVVEHLLVTALNAQQIRFHPKTYHGHTSMRVEVYGCRNGVYKSCIHDRT